MVNPVLLQDVRAVLWLERREEYRCPPIRQHHYQTTACSPFASMWPEGCTAQIFGYRPVYVAFEGISLLVV